jgi:3-(3-hydroxy-phenyl)propionate hydroxylase
MRTAVLGLAARHPGLSSLINPRQTSAITYRGSPLNAPGDESSFRAGPTAGAVLSECRVTLVGDGRAAPREAHLTDLLSLAPAPAFTALLFDDDEHDDGAAAAVLQGLQEELAATGVPLQVITLARRPGGSATAHDASARLHAMYDAAPGTLYLVRPDGHVLGRWRAARANALRAAVRRALGH